MKNREYIEYTYKHRKIVIYLANKYVKENKEETMNQIEFHDLDKLYMYLFYNKKDVSNVHRQLSSHHDNSIEKTDADYVEMVLDWESARYTKPDKPLNAYDTLYKYYPEMKEKILPILKKFKIDKSGLPMEEDVLEYAKSLSNTSIDDIKEELKKQIRKLMTEVKGEFSKDNFIKDTYFQVRRLGDKEIFYGIHNWWKGLCDGEINFVDVVNGEGTVYIARCK